MASAQALSARAEDVPVREPVARAAGAQQQPRQRPAGRGQQRQAAERARRRPGRDSELLAIVEIGLEHAGEDEQAQVLEEDASERVQADLEGHAAQQRLGSARSFPARAKRATR